MSSGGVHRFLSKREKHHSVLGRHHGSKHQLATATEEPDDSATDFYGLFISDEPAADKEEETKIKLLQMRIKKSGMVEMKEPHIIWALRSRVANGDADKAYILLMIMVDSWEGVLRDYKPSTKLVGAVNRHNVTCYLDALLFAMFSRLSSFEAMLYNSFETPAKQRLAIMLRMWINMLRSGEIITTDITKMLQGSLAECGWVEAAELCQQDTSEAFTFITSQLELPLLTLKMDIYHTGKEDAKDDHKFINERLLEVAIPERSPEGSRTVTLEDCLETYFNNRIEVRRYLERRSTLSSVRSNDSDLKSGAVHVETVEMDSPESPITPESASDPPRLRRRNPSIVQQRFVPDRNDSDGARPISTSGEDGGGRLRKGSIRTEVMMPAWQFFSLIPWYTGNTPTNDAQVAAHFSSQRPILGVCLKRYSMTAHGRAIRLDTQIDIPVEIGLPHFIQDDHFNEEAPIYGNFKLSLQSVVCHRGNSVHSGHYISLVRSTTGTTPGEISPDASSHWMRFDDLASERITLIDIHQAMKDETPYLLFYQILPIDGDPGHITDGEHASLAVSEGADSGIGMSNSTSTIAAQYREGGGFAGSSDPRTQRRSMEIIRGRSPGLEIPENRRASIAFSEPDNLPDSSADSRRGSRSERRPNLPQSQSQISTEKLSSAFSKLTKRSKDRLVTSTPDDTNAATMKPSNEGMIVPDVAILEASPIKRPTDWAPVPSQLPSRPPRSKSADLGSNAKGKSVLAKEHPHHHKREKSKSRTKKLQHAATTAEGGKPDRECVVM